MIAEVPISACSLVRRIKNKAEGVELNSESYQAQKTVALACRSIRNDTSTTIRSRYNTKSIVAYTKRNGCMRYENASPRISDSIASK